MKHGFGRSQPKKPPPPAIVNIHAAKTQFSKLLARVAKGETIIIAKANRPIARLGPLPQPTALGWARDLGVWIAPDFDAPLLDFEKDFYGG
ncbi:MAG TPA: type II toxin-antitoxin system prevent-host-death family antitoxin [Terriglobales bacterium]|jgi:prevent-host-death family protein